VKVRRPSPAMIVACIALFVSLGGSSVAAISFARNAGAVDGKSAVGAKASLKHAAGKLVAAGPNGKIRSRFLERPGRPVSFGSYVPVTDNATGSPVTIASIAGIGELTATCADQNNRAGVEDPITRLTFNNNSGVPVNFSRQIGGANATVTPQLAGTVETFQIPGANSFRLHAQNSSLTVNMLVDGVVRQDAPNTGDAKCLVYGVTFRVAR
jgi:hypothetical protein